MVSVAYGAGAKTAVVTAFRANLRTVIGSMAVTLNCDCNVAKVAYVEWEERDVKLLYRLSDEGGLTNGKKRVHEWESHVT